MTRSQITPLLALVGVLLTACTRDDGDDYCKNHYTVHASHSDQIARFDATLADDGALSVKLWLPESAYEGQSMGFLEQTERVFRVDSEAPCQAAGIQIDNLAGGLEANYEFECGRDNRVKQVDVTLFDSVPALDEVESRISTSATQKHFAISRQCDAAIFRLQRKN